jgi:two-component system, NtrC family, sensor kinase
MKRRAKPGRNAVKTQRRKTLSRCDAPKNARNGRSAAARQETEIARLTRELHEAREQQAATSEVLGVISSSPGELGPVFDAILENATRICGGRLANLFLYSKREHAFRLAAQRNAPAAYAERWAKNPVLRIGENPRNPLERLARTRRVVAIPDLMAEPGYIDRDPRFVALVEGAGARTHVLIPMLKEGELVGGIAVYRQKILPFTDRQLELLRNFAAQAVIAIENARLLSELRESLQQQTATADVLKVISSSPGNLEPVFQAMLANAVHICDAKFGTLFRFDGDLFQFAAEVGTPARLADFERQRGPFRPPSGTLVERVRQTKQVQHTADYSAEPVPGASARLGGARSAVCIPMLKDGLLVGVFLIYRQEVRPFSDKQIELLKNFAAQAVIAIENTRLLNELHQRTDDLSESLEQQTATSEVLRVISSSPTNVQPVFDTIAERAVRLCDGQFSFVVRFDGKIMDFASCCGLSAEGLDAFRAIVPMPATEGTAAGRAIIRRAVVEIPNVEADPSYGATAQGLAKAVTYRSIAAVPLLHEGNPIGAIAVARANAGSFPKRQIALLQAFADQAVVAIGNVRLFDEVQARTRELSESLEQQMATSEVLKIISSSPGDLKPVFQSMLDNSVRICEAKFGQMFLCEGDKVRAVATLDVPVALVQEDERRGAFQPSAEGGLARAIRTKKVLHIEDLMSEQPSLPVVKLGGARSYIAVPMLKESEIVGVIVIYRQEVRPFTDKQVDLVKNFAAQAVIAIENTRLLSELRESLQQQTATADVLKVISRSTFDLQTVLDTLVQSATRLCEAEIGNIWRPGNAGFGLAASFSITGKRQEALRNKEYLQSLTIAPARGSIVGRTLIEGRVVQVPDLQNDPEYNLKGVLTLGDYRTAIGVPLLREGTPIGVLFLSRTRVEPFTPQQIALVETFADQAVIAIENVRLFESVEARTRELAQSLDDLRTTQDRLVQTQKLASLGQLTAGIAHEIKNPLNFVNNFSTVSSELVDELQDLVKGLSVDDKARKQIDEVTGMLRGNLDKVVQHGKRADAIVRNMLQHSREGSGERRVVDINALVEESLNLAYHGARAEKQGFNITLERSFDPAAGQADVFPQDITRVLLNLILNGFYAATKRKEADSEGYEPILMASTRSLGDRVEIRVRDNGTGIPSEVKDKMFNPFFTTKPAGEGTGLGLSISHDIIVKQHGGSIEVETELGEYTEFRIILPRAAAFVTTSGAQS